ncbi:hypothetical protein PGUG_00664 [Meyerozyma guilliermondii ATCC 6260]|uniref:BZIP domain-containing protein n=1 Tax=Meyerozyma guilliermondii (strain ATCC 6260 / CBS 566 / DSM 6381 / JCM 1539 / NBRC 10279 / NRRL Y-324) TaxID=294746 RepID=A5DBK9_PICGU|nr:uncharacterized protein PGUG_00664 [Meyerozyma guilliermondii ATCC 6260]EDK36566.2 hypothetical protein PGUG_00664 [Meyerozyma guilliermondii ATCC 6260]
MADVKRAYSQFDTPSDHVDKKLHTKPGRKPIETEPKSKRTAQNRAAQRAYRERKERKMKDLEDKVSSLEEQNIKVATESDFLKAQVDMLKQELARYRGTTDLSDLNSKLPTHTKPSVPRPQTNSSVSSDSTNSNNAVSADFPWSDDTYNQSPNVEKYNASNNKDFPLPDLIGGSSSSTSPLNDNILVSPDSGNSISSGSNPPTAYNPTPDFYKFEEDIDPFCSKLNEACGTKQDPVPKDLKANYASPFASKTTPAAKDNTDYVNDSFFNGRSTFDFDLSNNNTDPLSFLNDKNFDVSLAFSEDLGSRNNGTTEKVETDPLAFLTTEESAYDPLKDSVNVDFNFNDFVKSSISGTDSTRDTVVSYSPEANLKDFTNRTPATEASDYSYTSGKNDVSEIVPAPEKGLKCSEIWERITNHPKYTEIDIDGLCSELKSKAKCSERGVVVNSTDVNQLLEQSGAMKR